LKDYRVLDGGVLIGLDAETVERDQPPEGGETVKTRFPIKIPLRSALPPANQRKPAPNPRANSITDSLHNAVRKRQ
jgi:hypothetical protein